MNSASDAPLIHEYNAAKRREYYLRTRKLKGRIKKAVIDPTARRKAAQAKKLAQHKALEAKVAALQGRLDALRLVLKTLVAQAQKKSGVASATDKSKEAVKKAADAASEPKTPKEKAAAKKASEKYAKSHPDEKSQPLSEQAKNLSAKIKTIEARIEKLRAKKQASGTKDRLQAAIKSSSPTKK